MQFQPHSNYTLIPAEPQHTKKHRRQSKLLEGKAGRGAAGAEAHQLKGGWQVNAGLRRQSLLNLEIRQKFEI